jgi:hypothetical protein
MIFTTIILSKSEKKGVLRIRVERRMIFTMIILRKSENNEQLRGGR